MSQQLRLKFFGHIEIERAGIPLTGFRSKKTLALLGYLAVTGRAHTRAALAGLLWGDLPDTKAHNSLSQTLTNLHHIVGSALIITRQAVAFDRHRPYWLDVARFETDVGSDSTPVSVERLREAVELYRGDFLEGFYVQDALAFEEWSLAQRARLRELALQALHSLVVYYCRQGQAGVPQAITYATRLLALEPWREEAHRQMMLLLALCGQRSAALAQYETCRRILAEELGVEPAPDTVALYERIRAGELSAAPETAGRSAPLFTTLPPFLSVQLPALASARTFVARAAESARLTGWLELALAGQGRVAFVSGEMGQGKTALMHAFARKAQQEYPQLLVAAGNCTAYGGIGDPYLPFRDILRLLTGDIEAQWVAGTISYADARRFWALLPEAAQVLVSLAPDLIDTLVSGEALLARAGAAAPESSTWLDRLRSLVAGNGPSPGHPADWQPNLFEQLAERHRLVQAGRLIQLDNCHLTCYHFRHGLTQKYLYTRLPETERALLHQAVGQALEALYGPHTEKVAAQLAWHFQAAGLAGKAITYLYQAGVA